MLRDFVYSLDSAVVMQALGKFDLPMPAEKHKFSLLEFRVLTPDSFAWKFLINEVIYHLYAEDFVQGLADVRSKISSYATNGKELTFIKAKHPEEFANAGPVKSATVYDRPKDADEMMAYAVSSGYDFVFLCRSDEDAGRALFSD